MYHRLTSSWQSLNYRRRFPDTPRSCLSMISLKASLWFENEIQNKQQIITVLNNTHFITEDLSLPDSALSGKDKGPGKEWKTSSISFSEDWPWANGLLFLGDYNSKYRGDGRGGGGRKRWRWRGNVAELRAPGRTCGPICLSLSSCSLVSHDLPVLGKGSVKRLSQVSVSLKKTTAKISSEVHILRRKRK